VHTTRVADAVIGDHGVRPNDELYHTLVPASTNLGEIDHAALIERRPQQVVNNLGGAFQLFRIGDAVAARNVHAAILDALRLCHQL
jgi:hypothetical protein